MTGYLDKRDTALGLKSLDPCPEAQTGMVFHDHDQVGSSRLRRTLATINIIQEKSILSYRQTGLSKYTIRYRYETDLAPKYSQKKTLADGKIHFYV